MLKELKHQLDKLKEFTKDCREDMHEPDEQCLNAVVSGFSFDNAGSDFEIKVTLTDYSSGKYMTINLATLIAFARKAEL